MALFKKDKKEEGLKEKKEAKKVKTAKKTIQKKEQKTPEKALVQKAKKGEIKLAPVVLLKPQITEKATFLQEKNQYVFQVFKTATKLEVKKAIKEIYGVNVEKVRIINVDRKKKRLGRTTGWKKGYKKAIVSLPNGQEIEIIPR